MDNTSLLILTERELWAFLIGSLGLIVPIVWYWKHRKSKKHTSSPTLGIHKQVYGDNTWWNALEKSRSKFQWSAQSTKLESLKDSVEEACLASDLGIANTNEALASLPWSEIINAPQEQRETHLKQALADVLETWLKTATSPEVNTLEQWPLKKNPSGPTVLWFVGVNGAGKTTTIAKIAKELKEKGYSVMLAAGDTFRAAASEQLQTWAERLEIPCVRGAEGADSSAVLFDAIQSAQAKKIDFVLCDSAGRLHNNRQLMESLMKNKRVMEKALAGAPHETLLVLDANTGQNMVKQAESFLADVQATGLILTKVDGSARGGAVVAVSRHTKLPILKLGLGEKAEHMKSFDSKAFSRALVGLD